MSRISLNNLLHLRHPANISFLLIFDLLLHIVIGFLGDVAHKILHALWPHQEVHKLVVLSLTLLQDVLLIHYLCQRNVILLQERVDVGRRVQIELPKHGAAEE